MRDTDKQAEFRIRKEKRLREDIEFMISRAFENKGLAVDAQPTSQANLVSEPDVGVLRNAKEAVM